MSTPSTFTFTKYVPVPQFIFEKLSAVDPWPIIILSTRPYLFVNVVWASVYTASPAAFLISKMNCTPWLDLMFPLMSLIIA